MRIGEISNKKQEKRFSPVRTLCALVDASGQMTKQGAS
jgi:hypothetical protein